MKGKPSLAILSLIMVSVFALYVFAQAQTDKQQGDVRKAQQKIDSLQQEKQKMVRQTLLFNSIEPKSGLTLILGIGEDGEVKHAVVRRPNSSISNIQKIRIEMMDGTVQEVDLKKIKKMTVE